MRSPLPRPEFFAKESIDSPDDKIAPLPLAEASEGWLLFSSSTTVISKTHLGKQLTMAISPARRPVLPKKSGRLALKACCSTSKELQEQLSLSSSEMSNPGMIDDPFCSSASDSDSSNEEYNEYTNSSTELWDLYFSEEEKSSYQWSPLYQVDAPKSSQLCLQDGCISPQNNLASPLRRSDAQRTPRRATQPSYSAFPPVSSPRTSTNPHPEHASWPTRKESRLNPKGHTCNRPRAHTTPSVPSSANSSHLALCPPHSAPCSPYTIQPFMPMLEKSVWEHDDDEKSGWRKALHIRASSSGCTGSDEKKNSWTRKKARNVVKGLFGGKKATSLTSSSGSPG